MYVVANCTFMANAFACPLGQEIGLHAPEHSVRGRSQGPGMRLIIILITARQWIMLIIAHQGLMLIIAHQCLMLIIAHQ